MSSRDPKQGHLLNIGAYVAEVAGLPPPLPGDPRRQAVASIRGDIYQAWWSIDAWLRLSDADDVIYLEGAEDFDYVTRDEATSVQVKHYASSISLGNAKAREALNNFWTLSTQVADRRIEFHYLTTSTLDQEKGDPFGGVSGIEAWRAAQTRVDFAGKIGAYLVRKLDAKAPLRLFLEKATSEEVQERLIRRFHWLTDQPDLEAVKDSVNDRITVLLAKMNRSASMCNAVRKQLWSSFWDFFLQPEPKRRCLTHAELLRQIDAATHTLLSVPTDTLPALLMPQRPGLALFNALLETPPVPPEPLLARDLLTQEVAAHLQRRAPVLLTGTVHKGKTTIAQLVIHALCPHAWWLGLTGRSDTQATDVINVLAHRIEDADCPALIVIDDLDLSPTAQAVYRNALALAVHRVSGTGRGLLLTARGDTSHLLHTPGLNGIATVEVTEIDAQEAARLSVDHGCPEALAPAWGAITTATTGGHPKLVQVRLAELASRGWPSPSAADLSNQSPAISSARHLARRLLSESLPTSSVEFLYVLSESLIPLKKGTAILLAETIDGIANAGDVLSDLTGTWVESAEDARLRTTSLLKGVAADVWSPQNRELAHRRLHDALLKQETVTPAEASAMLFHAWIAHDVLAVGRHAATLLSLDRAETEQAVDRHLFWLPFVALDQGQVISEDPIANATLRLLQFRASTALEVDNLRSVCDRWIDDVIRIEQPQPRAGMSAMLWMSIGSSQSEKIPLIYRLRAAYGILRIPAELKALVQESRISRISISTSIGLPEQATTAQVFLLFSIQSVREFDKLETLLCWLDQDASDQIRADFDAILEWPIVQTLGAFVHGAWAKDCEATTNWQPWLDLLERIEHYAKRRISFCLGREAAKARAIILTEYLDDSIGAMRVLADAESVFGTSAVIAEQRVNLLSQIRDDEAALRAWSEVVSDTSNHFALNAFAYRRAAQSAARLKRWDSAEALFLEAAAWDDAGQSEILRFGLRLDAALAASYGGCQICASRHLLRAILGLPAEASADGDPRWEAVQRAASTICKDINNAVWNPDKPAGELEPGFASAPDLTVPEVAPKQSARTEIGKALTLRFATTLEAVPEEGSRLLDELDSSRMPFIRWLSAESRLAQAYAKGAGAAFIPSLLAFDRALTSCVREAGAGASLLVPDAKVQTGGPAEPERWFGLLTAAVACAEAHLSAHADVWLRASLELLGENAKITHQLRLLFEGLTTPQEKLRATVATAENSRPLRVGAAAQMYLQARSAEETCLSQMFLASAMFADESGFRQDIFNRHVAVRFAQPWRRHVENRFQFYNPRSSVPALIQALDEVELGSGTLRRLLEASCTALRVPLGDFFCHVK